jgi:uncharacterized membrane protein
MALDHVRDYFHAPAFLFDPLDLNKTTVAIFLTRFITHYCAPIFMLLTGTSAFLVGERKGTKGLSVFLLKRGLFLILMEWTIINFGWSFNLHVTEIDLLVMWSLGFSMIALSAMIWLPKNWILAIGIVLVAGHNLLDGVHVAGKGIDAFLWSVLHEVGFYQFWGMNFFVMYPIMPWVGTIALGYSLGRLYKAEITAEKRKKILLQLGIGLVCFFVVLRFSNFYGDASHWVKQPNFIFTILSFINVSKYPPSLLYLSITLGPALIFLAVSETALGKLGKFISVYGRVPMFYYILHIYLIHLLALVATYLCGHTWKDMISGVFNNISLKGYGFSLLTVYGVWAFVVLTLYPLCSWYDKYKSNHKEKKWLSYL